MNKLVKSYYLSKIYLIETFWIIRVNIFILFPFGYKFRNTLKNLKENGYVIFKKYYSEEEVKQISDECNFQLNNIQIVDNIERIPGSIKLKNLGKNNFFFKKIQQNFFLKIIAIIYSFKLKLIRNGALMIYSLTHDGSFKNKNVEGSFKGKMIAGDPHLDSPIHEIKAFVALNDIMISNGPFASIKKSNKFDINLMNNYLGMHKGIPNSEIINSNYVAKKSKISGIFKATVKKGDLVIIDTRSIHYASSLISGKREMLWFYY